SVKTTLAPTTGLPLPSVTRTDGGLATEVPTVADVDGTPFTAMFAAPLEVPVALKLTVPTTVPAVTVFVPAVLPSDHDVSEAVPVASVATTIGPAPPLIWPVPWFAVSVNVTFTPATGLLWASRTRTDGAVTAAPTAALWLVAVSAMTELAAPAWKTTVAVCEMAMAVPSVAIAVYVTDCATVFVTSNVTTPDAFDDALEGVIADDPLPWLSVTVLPATGLDCASRSVTVIVEVVEPSAVIGVAEAVTVDCVVETVAATNV